VLIDFKDDKPSSVCICDFGISKNIDVSSAHTVAGTAQYMAPEIFSGYQRYDGLQADGICVSFN
jgi:serine/threonine protein kinase